MTDPVWQWKPRFRRRAFGWKSQPAIARVKEAISEIKQVAKKDPLLGAEGAVLFLERVAPAIEQVDSSSGGMGTAVNRAIETLVPLIASAPAERKTREGWLDRLWQARADDDMPYLELLDEHWGELCAGAELASIWADRFLGTLAMAWSPDPELRGMMHGSVACFSALLAARRYDDILTWLQRAPYVMWHWRVWGVRALAALGQADEALAYAQASIGRNDSPVFAVRESEAVLLAAGRSDEAYRDFAILANQAASNVGTYRAIAKKYPHIPPKTILRDLIASTPGDEGKWFATAKDLGLFDVAVALARQSPCDPKTLGRAARDFAEERPAFAVESGLAALHWLALDYGYDITSGDVWAAYHATLKAAEVLGDAPGVLARVRETVAAGSVGNFARQVLGRVLGG